MCWKQWCPAAACALSAAGCMRQQCRQHSVAVQAVPCAVSASGNHVRHGQLRFWLFDTAGEACGVPAGGAKPDGNTVWSMVSFSWGGSVLPCADAVPGVLALQPLLLITLCACQDWTCSSRHIVQGMQSICALAVPQYDCRSGSTKVLSLLALLQALCFGRSRSVSHSHRLRCGGSPHACCWAYYALLARMLALACGCASGCCAVCGADARAELSGPHTLWCAALWMAICLGEPPSRGSFDRSVTSRLQAGWLWLMGLQAQPLPSYM
jgi:hypothetical protein